jgi:hypothetical protein
MQSPSWETNKSSASPEFSRILWNPNVHYCTYKCPPSWGTTGLFEGVGASGPEGLELKYYSILSARHLFLNASVQVRGIAKCFVTLEFECLAPRSTPKLKDHPLLDVCDSLFNIFTAHLLIWMPFLPPQTEDAPFCGHRDALTCFL